MTTQMRRRSNVGAIDRVVYTNCSVVVDEDARRPGEQRREPGELHRVDRRAAQPVDSPTVRAPTRAGRRA